AASRPYRAGWRAGGGGGAQRRHPRARRARHWLGHARQAAAAARRGRRPFVRDRSHRQGGRSPPQSAARPMSAPRILFYVQHLLGIGHLRRAIILAAAMREAGLAVTLVSGGMPDEGEKAEGVAVVHLSPLRAGDAELRTIVDA